MLCTEGEEQVVKERVGRNGISMISDGLKANCCAYLNKGVCALIFKAYFFDNVRELPLQFLYNCPSPVVSPLLAVL